MTTRIVEFNDIPALEKALSDGQVAAVLAEPAMTNRGIILPDAGNSKINFELFTSHISKIFPTFPHQKKYISLIRQIHIQFFFPPKLTCIQVTMMLSALLPRNTELF